MRDNREQLGLPDDRAAWPQPKVLESIWRFYAYKMARIHLNVGEGRRVPGSDLYDAHRYVSASHCDVLVTDDDDFRTTCGVIPGPRFTLYTFDEFVSKELGVGRT